MLLKTFGGLSMVSAEGTTPAAMTQRRRLCLLAVLAETGEAGATREKLLGLLWPDAGEERGRAALAQALYALRQGLGTEDVIEGTTTLRLNRQLLDSDVEQFRAAKREGRFQAAAELYQGPFLDGVYLPGAPDFERWVDETRAELAGAAAEVFESAAKRASASGDHVTAVALWRRRAALDPYHAPSALGLMRALADAGDRAAAVRHARTYQSLVSDQLGVAPDAAVPALAEELSRGGAAASASPATPTPAAPGATRQAVETPAATPASSVPTPGAATAPAAKPRVRESAIAVAALIIVLVTLAAGAWRLLSKRGSDFTRAVADTSVLAVGGFNGHGPGADELASALTDLLSTSLARAPGVTVISTARLAELAGRREGAPNDSTRPLLEAARAGGATALIDGALYVQPSGIRLDLRRTDLGTGRVIQAITLQAPDLFAAVDSGTRGLLHALAPAPSGSIADVTTSSVAAYRLYAAGLREYYANRLPAAYPLFVAALAEDSLFAMAEFQAWQCAPTLEAQIGHLSRAMRLAPRASERERLLIQWTWASTNDEPIAGALAESLMVHFAAEPFAPIAFANTLISQARFLEAIPVLQRALALDRGAPSVTPGRCTDCEAHYLLVATYRLLDSTAAAEREARAYARQQPERADAWRVLAEELLTLGKIDEAIAARQRAVDLGEQFNMAAYQAYSGIFSMDYATLTDWYVSVLRTGDAALRADAAWWLTIGYRAQGRLRDALETARIVRGNRTFGQRGVAPYEALSEAQVLAEMGRPREAAMLFDSIGRLRSPGLSPARLARHQAWLLTHVANSRALAGDTAGLLALADSIEALGRKSGFARDQRLHHHVRGLLYAARGQHAAAAESFRRAIYSPVGGYSRTNQALARELVILGKPDEAVPWLRSALRGGAEGSNLYLPITDLHEGLALAFSAAGRHDSARVHATLTSRAWQRADASFAARRAVMDSLAR